MSHKRVVIAKRRKRTVLKEKIYLILIAVFIVVICSFTFGGIFTTAHGNAQEAPFEYKYYKSIELQEGDTLWSIAENYRTDDIHSTASYVEELKRINHLHSDSIEESNYLTVAYNDTQFQ